jgi:hypothetical protein
MISFLINILLILYTQGQKKEKPKAVDNKNPSKKIRYILVLWKSKRLLRSNIVFYNIVIILLMSVPVIYISNDMHTIIIMGYA